MRGSQEDLKGILKGYDGDLKGIFRGSLGLYNRFETYFVTGFDIFSLQVVLPILQQILLLML